MAQAISFICSFCHERIEDCDSPVLVYVVASIAPMHPQVLEGRADVTDLPLPEKIREILLKPRQRREYCAGCFAREFSQPLLDVEGVEVASPEEAKDFLDGAKDRPALLGSEVIEPPPPPSVEGL